ncbi:gfo/Idh/MocA family oxidoreductase [Erwinia sp. CPCC 100877]|nr:gfo/Idh/MocA family oxidoreductase [Erwinia sp. CPCC 100877]
MRKIRYGIISTARIVPRFVAGVAASEAGAVSAIGSRTLAKAEKMAVELAIPKAYGSYEAVCQDEEVDVVYVATYNQGHYAAAKLALQHHKHVLVEKPFTLKLEQAEELFELAAENRCFLMEAQKSVFLPISQQVKKALQQNKIGKVQWLQSVTTYPNIDHISWFHSLEAGGGVLHGSGSYPLQYMQYLLDQPIKEFSGAATKHAGRTDDQANISLRFANQVLANIFLSVKLDILSKMTLYGEQGRIEIPHFWKAKSAMIVYEDGRQEVLSSEYESEFVFELNHVNECLQKNLLESPVMTKKLTLATVQLVETLYNQWSD